MDSRKAAQELLECGATVIPFLAEEELREEHAAVLKALTKELPEYQVRDSGKRITFDPTGKLGGSSSHHVTIRRLRQKAFQLHREIGRELFRSEEGPWYITCIPDAAMIRRSCDKVSGNWHRDCYAGGFVFGGWINLDFPEETAPQLFVYGSGSHMESGRLIKGAAPGFKKLTNKEVEGLQITEAKVFPGEMLVFLENIAHTVSNNARRRKTAYMLRLFTASRISQEPVPLQVEEAIVDAMKKKKSLPIKGGRPVALIPRNGAYKNSAKTVEKARTWVVENIAQQLHPLLTENLDAEVPCLSLEAPLFPQYEEAELKIYKPSCLFHNVSRKRWRTGVLK